MVEHSHDSSRSSMHLSTLVPSLWSLLTEHEKELLLIWTSTYIFKKEEVIYDANTIPQNCYILADGKVKISKEGYSDRTQIMRMVEPGGFFGYTAHFASLPYASKAIAIEKSVLCLVPMHILETIIRCNPEVALFIIQDLSKRNAEGDQLTISLTQKHTRGRLAEALLMLKDKYGMEQDEATISIYLSRKELAMLSNMTTSNAIRTLYTFEEERVIAVDGRKIKILDEEKLIRISQLG